MCWLVRKAPSHSSALALTCKPQPAPPRAMGPSALQPTRNYAREVDGQSRRTFDFVLFFQLEREREEKCSCRGNTVFTFFFFWCFIVVELNCNKSL